MQNGKHGSHFIEFSMTHLMLKSKQLLKCFDMLGFDCLLTVATLIDYHFYSANQIKYLREWISILTRTDLAEKHRVLIFKKILLYSRARIWMCGGVWMELGKVGMGEWQCVKTHMFRFPKPS